MRLLSPFLRARLLSSHYRNQSTKYRVAFGEIMQATCAFTRFKLAIHPIQVAIHPSRMAIHPIQIAIHPSGTRDHAIKIGDQHWQIAHIVLFGRGIQIATGLQ